MKWIVRDATVSDLDAVVRIDQASHAVPWPKDALRDCITGHHGSVLIVVCRRNGTGAPAGFAAGRFLSGEFEILNIAVSPGKRNQGLGSLLMEALKEKALAAGCSTWILEVRESNRPARRLYEKFGLLVTGKRAGYYADTGEPALLMAGNLTDLWTNDQKSDGRTG